MLAGIVAYASCHSFMNPSGRECFTSSSQRNPLSKWGTVSLQCVAIKTDAQLTLAHCATKYFWSVLVRCSISWTMSPKAAAHCQYHLVDGVEGVLIELSTRWIL